MKKNSSASRLGVLTILATGVALAVSCSESEPVATRPPSPPSEVGRYQVVVMTEGERGSAVFLVDTKEGMTWIYRMPQGAAMNGFWSNIPKLQVADAYWEQALRSLFTPVSQQAPAPSGGTPVLPSAPPDLTGGPASSALQPK